MLEVKGTAEGGTEFEFHRIRSRRRATKHTPRRIPHHFCPACVGPRANLAPAYPKPLLSTRSRHVRCTAFCADAATVLELSKLKSYRR
jgi:hypothetical protein